MSTLLLGLACAAITWLLAGSSAFAGAAGEIDTGFNAGLARLVDLAPAGTNLDEARATVVQPDGKMIVAGRSMNGGVESFAVTRFNVDGSIDTTFGTNGTWSMAFGNAGSSATGVALSGSRIIVAGYGLWGSSGDFVVVQLTASGQLDTSGAFGSTNGYVTINFGGDDQATAVTVDGTGKVVVVGTTSLGGGDAALAKLMADGTLDTSFGTGRFTKDFSGGAADVVNDVEVDATNRVYVAGSKTNGANTEFLVARFTTDGSLDNGFGSTGVWSSSIGTTNDVANGLDIVPATGTVVAAGVAGNSAGPGAEMAIVRLTSAGLPDSSWTSGTNPAGIVTKGFGGTSSDVAYGVVVDADGRVVVAGTTTSVSPQAVAVVRYNDDATLDPTWSSNGDVVTPNPAGAATINGWAIALSGQRDIVVAGSAMQAAELDTLLVRYEGDVVSGVTTLDFGGCTGSALSFGNQPASTMVQTGADCAISFGNTTNTSMLRVYQQDGTGTAMTGPGTINDYGFGADWSTSGTPVFGACLRQVTGIGASTSSGWIPSGGAACSMTTSEPWRGIPPNAGSAGIKIASATSPGQLVTARLRFGVRTIPSTPPGLYTARLAFEVVDPDA